LGIRQVVVGVEVAVNVDIPRIQSRVVHMQPTKRTGPEIRASSRAIPNIFIYIHFPSFLYVFHRYQSKYQ